MLGFIIFILFHLAGIALEEWLHIPLPANVIGMALLATALFTKVIKLEWVEGSSQFLLKHMGFFFIPAIVGTAAFADRLQSYWLSIAASIVVSTLMTMLATGLVVKLWHRKGTDRDVSESHSA